MLFLSVMVHTGIFGKLSHRLSSVHWWSNKWNAVSIFLLAVLKYMNGLHNVQNTHNNTRINICFSSSCVMTFNDRLGNISNASTTDCNMTFIKVQGHSRTLYNSFIIIMQGCINIYLRTHFHTVYHNLATANSASNEEKTYFKTVSKTNLKLKLSTKYQYSDNGNTHIWGV